MWSVCFEVLLPRDIQVILCIFFCSKYGVIILSYFSVVYSITYCRYIYCFLLYLHIELTYFYYYYFDIYFVILQCHLSISPQNFSLSSKSISAIGAWIFNILIFRYLFFILRIQILFEMLLRSHILFKAAIFSSDQSILKGLQNRSLSVLPPSH